LHGTSTHKELADEIRERLRAEMVFSVD